MSRPMLIDDHVPRVIHKVDESGYLGRFSYAMEMSHDLSRNAASNQVTDVPASSPHVELVGDSLHDTKFGR